MFIFAPKKFMKKLEVGRLKIEVGSRFLEWDNILIIITQ